MLNMICFEEVGDKNSAGSRTRLPASDGASNWTKLLLTKLKELNSITFEAANYENFFRQGR